MKRFAANRVCWLGDKNILRNQVVELNETTHAVERVFSLEEEIRQTEWIGGMILLSPIEPIIEKGESFSAFLSRHRDLSASTPLYAYHITAFDVSSMEFTSNSRIKSL